MTNDKFRGPLYSRLMRQLRENNYGCFTDESRADYFRRISLPAPAAPRGQPGKTPSEWTRLSGFVPAPLYTLRDAEADAEKARAHPPIIWKKGF